jgi:hypothetical protein
MKALAKNGSAFEQEEQDRLCLCAILDVFDGDEQLAQWLEE